MQINKELAIKILKYQDQHKDFYFPFQVIYKSATDSDDFVEIEPSQWRTINNVGQFEKIELRENLQNIFGETIELMAKGFVEKILNSENLDKNYIFYTTEGYTFSPDQEGNMPDVENCQVLGWGKGKSADEAFCDFKKQNDWLERLKFNEVICAELKDEKTYNFFLKN